MRHPTPVHRPVWRSVHDAVHGDVWAAIGGVDVPVPIYASTASIYANDSSLYASSLTNPHT